MKIFASIYIGSYETTMRVYEIGKTKGIKEIDCLKMPSDIIKDVLMTGKISFETTDRLCRVLNDMKRVMDSYKTDAYSVVAGPNIRQAENDLFVIEQIKIRCGLQVEVISNSEQRFFSYESVASTDGFDEYINDSALIIDVGGVTLQITLFHKGRIVTTQHLTLGTVSISENLRKLGMAMGNSIEQTYEMMYKELELFKTMFLRDIEPRYLILLGDQISTFTEKLNGVSEKLIECSDYLGFLNSLDGNYIKNYEIEHDVYLGNEKLMEPFVMLHKAIAETMAPKYIYIPGVSVCDGMALSYSFKKKWLSASHDFEADVISAAWSIAKRYGSYQPHLKALYKLSGMIFDATKKYHGMGKRERLLMGAIAILHDCGKYISLSEASDCSYVIIMSSEILGLTHKEREMIATTVAFNRKPLENYDSLSDRFTQDEYIIIVKLLAILKVANALDRSHKQKIKNVSMKVKDDELIIAIESNVSIALEKGLFNKNADFFQQIFSIRPVLKEI